MWTYKSVLKNKVINVGTVFGKRLCKGGQTSYFIHNHRLPKLSNLGHSVTKIVLFLWKTNVFEVGSRAIVECAFAWLCTVILHPKFTQSLEPQHVLFSCVIHFSWRDKHLQLYYAQNISCFLWKCINPIANNITDVVLKCKAVVCL